MYLKINDEQYYLVTFIDEYSRYLVHWELLTSMKGHSISTAAQRAIETLPVDGKGKLAITPIIRSDNGGGYISGEFAGLLSHHDLTHQRIRTHCPEEYCIQERFNLTFREGIPSTAARSGRGNESQSEISWKPAGGGRNVVDP